MFNKKNILALILMIGTFALMGCGASSTTTSSDTTTTTVTSATGYKVVDTGQVKSYSNSAEITTPTTDQLFYGQDANFTGTQPSYTLSSDSKTVLDNNTGLTWQRSPDTSGDGTIIATDKLSWTNAQARPAVLNAAKYGGYSDWRLPSIKELYSLMNFNGTDPDPTATSTSGLRPFIDTTYFQFAYGDTSAMERIIDSQYASSNLFVYTDPSQGSMLFGLNLADGRIKGYGLRMPFGDKTFFVQCVRGNSSYGVNSFVANADETVTDSATGLMWSKVDNGSALTWQDAMTWVQTKNAASYLGHNDWRMPNAKELHSIVNYSNAPDYNGKPAIDTTYFSCSSIINEAGNSDFPYYWTSTTHLSAGGDAERAVYIAFGRALGYETSWTDVHGAGAQRSDPKTAPSGTDAGTTIVTVTKNGVTYTGYAHGPQGDALRGYNYVRLVRDAQ